MYFKRLSTKNHTILQIYIKAKHGKEKSLLLYCKTRRNTLLTMLKRLTFLKSSIQKPFIVLNYPGSLEDTDFDIIPKIINLN